MIFCRKNKSVYMGTSMNAFNQIRDLLDAEKIPYRYRTTNRQNQWLNFGGGTIRSHTGSLGVSQEAAYEYEILVSPQDEKQAAYKIRTMKG